MAPYDFSNILKSKLSIDLKELSHKYSGGDKILLSAIGDAVNLKKLGGSGLKAIEHYRKGHWYELSRFVNRDNNILNFYLEKILKSVEGSALLVQDSDKKQISIQLFEIKKQIKFLVDNKKNHCDIHED